MKRCICFSTIGEYDTFLIFIYFARALYCCTAVCFDLVSAPYHINTCSVAVRQSRCRRIVLYNMIYCWPAVAPLVFLAVTAAAAFILIVLKYLPILQVCMTRDTRWLGRAYEFVRIYYLATGVLSDNRWQICTRWLCFSTANHWWAHPDPASAVYSIVSCHTCALAAQLLVIVGLCSCCIQLQMRCYGFSLLHC